MGDDVDLYIQLVTIGSCNKFRNILKLFHISVATCNNTVSFFAGLQWYHINKVRRYHNPGTFQVTDLPGLLLQDVLGHRASRGHTRPHLPPCAAQLYRSVTHFKSKTLKRDVRAVHRVNLNCCASLRRSFSEQSEGVCC